MNYRLSEPFSQGHCRENHFGFRLHRDQQSWDTQKWLGARRNGRGYQCQLHSRSDSGCWWLALQMTLAAFAAEEIQGPAQLLESLQTSAVFAPQVFALAETSWLRPYPLILPRTPTPEGPVEPITPTGSQPGPLWLCKYSLLSRSPQLTSITICALGAIPPPPSCQNCMFHVQWLITRPHSHAHVWGRLCSSHRNTYRTTGTQICS